MELLFDNQKTINTQVPATFVSSESGVEEHAATIKDLIGWMATNLLKERPELFIGPDGSV
jgi:ubiquitin related modifier 1